MSLYSYIFLHLSQNIPITGPREVMRTRTENTYHAEIGSLISEYGIKRIALTECTEFHAGGLSKLIRKYNNNKNPLSCKQIFVNE